MKFYTTSQLSENMHETPEGYLVCIGVPIARTGEMEYGPGETPLDVGPDGKVIVTRDSEEVFRVQTMASFEGKAVTITHPPEFVSPENWKELAKGSIQNVRRGKGENENDLIADLLITDIRAIELVKNGLREVSCGYEAEYVPSGIGRGVQKNIIGNHLALVDQGRAGAAYKINDSKGKGSKMKLSEKIKALFGKAQDDAMKLVAEATDADPANPPVEAGSYDELVKMVKDLGAKIEGMKPAAKDEVKPPTQVAPAEAVAKDAPVAGSVEERLAKLEALVEKLVGAQVGDEEKEDESEDAESDVITDKDGDDDEDDKSEDAESCDDDEEESEMTGDSASRIEILAPGAEIDLKSKGAKVKALKIAYATTDGKEVINQFTNGEVPDYKSQKLVNTIFIGASEVLKVRRNTELSESRNKTRDAFQSQMGVPKGAKTPEEINEINAKYWQKK